MVTVWALVILLQAEPQVFEFSLVVPNKKQCELGRAYLKLHGTEFYEASMCVEMKFPAKNLQRDKKGGVETPPNRPAKSVVRT
jgi:hypothetical protein